MLSLKTLTHLNSNRRRTEMSLTDNKNYELWASADVPMTAAEFTVNPTVSIKHCHVSTFAKHAYLVVSTNWIPMSTQ